MPHEFDAARPIYTQLAELITQAIVSGEYAPGQRLPGVRELAVQYGVNPNTVQRTMSDMEREGLVFAERTAGRFVTEDRDLIRQIKMNTAMKQAESFVKQMGKLGITREEMLELLDRAAEEGEKENE